MASTYPSPDPFGTGSGGAGSGGAGAAPEGRSALQRLSPLGVLIGALGFAASLTCVYMGMRSLMVQSGGFCASGGPYQIAAGHQCSSGQSALLFGGVFGMLAFGGLYSAMTGVGGGPGSGMDAGFLMWAALFGALGYNLLSLGFDPPAGQAGGGGWIVSGVVFELMALGGVVPLLWSAREWIARGGAPEPPMFAGPAVRANVNKDAVYVGVPGITNAYQGPRVGSSPGAAPGAPAPDAAATGQPAPLPRRLNIPGHDRDER